MKRFLLAILLVLLLPVGAWAADCVYTANGGNWTDSASWNSGAGPVPDSAKTVAVDSGITSIVINTTAACKSLDLTGTSGITTSGSGALSVYGNFTLDSSVTWNATGGIFFKTNACNLDTANKSLANCGGITIQSGASVTLVNNQLTLTGKKLTIRDNSTSFTTSNYNISCEQFHDGGAAGSPTIDLGTSTITCTGGISFAASTPTISHSGATINCTSVGDRTYAFNSRDWSGNTINIDTYDTRTSTITGSTNTLGTLGLTRHSGTTATVKFTAGTTNTFTSLSATNVVITSTTTSAATLSDSSGTNTFSGCTLSYITGSGGAVWDAFTNANTDSGNNTGIAFAVPTVTTQNASSVDKTTATGNGTITNTPGAVSEVGCCVSTSSANPTKADTYFTGTVVQTGAFTASMTGLSSSTLYHYSTYAISPAGTTYTTGNDFTTLANVSKPTVTCQDATDLAQTTATLNGNVTVNDGTVSAAGFYISTTHNPPTVADTTVSSSDFNGAASGTGAFTGAATSLTAGTTYHCVSFATNEAGTSTSANHDFTTARAAGSFYMRADGTAATLSAATGPASSVSSCMNVTVHNASTLIPDDTIYLSSQGGAYNSAIKAPNDGTSGHPITYTNVAGETVSMTNTFSLDGNTWTDLGGGKYSTSYAGTLYGMFEDGALLSKSADSNLSDGGTYYLTGGTLYYKPSSGTPSSHTLLGCHDWTSQGTLAGGASCACISIMDRSYITIKKNTTGSINISNTSAGILSWDNSASADITGIVIDGINITKCKDPIAIFHSPTYNTAGTISNCTATYCESFYRNYCSATGGVVEHTWTINNNTGLGIGTIDGTIKWNQNDAADREFIGIQNHCNCNIYGNQNIGGNNRFFYLYTKTGGHSTGNNFYNNFAYKNLWTGIYITLDDTTAYIDNNKFYNNIIIRNDSASEAGYHSGIYIPARAPADTYMNYFYNNVVYGASWGVYFDKYMTTPSTYVNFTFKNNIFVNCPAYIAITDATASNYAVDYNCYYNGTVGMKFLLGSSWKTFAQWQGLGNDAHGAEQNPKFSLAGGSSPSHYKLTSISPTTTPGVLHGADLSGTFTTDFAGTTRSNWYMGAYDTEGVVMSGGGLSPGLGISGGNVPPWILRDK